MSNCGSWRCLVRGSCPGTTTDAGEAVGGRPEPLADLLRQLDDDRLRAADLAEPITVFVAPHLANELENDGGKTYENLHRGARSFADGLYTAIRNPGIAHPGAE